MNIYEETPQTVSTVKMLREYVTYIRLEPRQLTGEELEANGLVMPEGSNEPQHEYWTANTIAYHHANQLTEADYGPMVTAVVRSKYSADDVEAIILNYYKDNRKEVNVTEFQELQAWREQAKEAARLALEQVA